MATVDVSALEIDLARVDRIARLAAAAFNTKLGPGQGFERLFEAGQGHWRPLSRRYLNSKRRQGRSPLIWINTGKTYRALVETQLEEDGKSSAFFLEVNPSSGETSLIPTDLDEGRLVYMNDSRPWFVWVPGDIDAMAEAVAAKLETILAEEGFNVGVFA